MNDFGQRERFGDWSRKLGEIMDEMLNRHYVEFRDGATWQPATDVFESRLEYYICVELAGVDNEKIGIQAESQRVVISGVRCQPRPDDVEGPLSVHAMEIDEGPFRRQIDLPEPVTPERIEARYNKGYLWIRLPKARR